MNHANAMVGPMIGGSWGEEGRDVPRSVSREYFYKTCSEVKVMRSAEVKDTFSGREPSAKELMDAWVAKIDSMEDRCIEIEKDSFQLFDIWYVLHIDSRAGAYFMPGCWEPSASWTSGPSSLPRQLSSASACHR